MTNDADDFIFIVGCARTGSKLHADMLNASSEINLTDELHFLAPRWVRNDFRKQVELVGHLQDNRNLEHLIEKMYTGKFAGTFWKKPSSNIIGSPPQTIFDLDKIELLERLMKTKRKLKDIFECLIVMQAERQNKKRAGAKFPVDIGYFETLYHWYPNAKFIHLVRDPRAIYTSMVSMDRKYGVMNNGLLKRQGRPIQRLLYLVSRYRKAAQIHKKYEGNSNYYVSSFEDMVNEPQERIQSLLHYLNINYEEAMLQPRIRSSSYGIMQASQDRGFDANVINRWEQHIPRGAEKLLRITLSSEMKLFGY